MLQQILSDMFIDPDLLAELDEEQKQILFCKIRQEQVRRWKEREEQCEIEERRQKLSPKDERQSKVKFIEGKDGQPWVWVMDDDVTDKPVEQAQKQAVVDAETVCNRNEEALLEDTKGETKEDTKEDQLKSAVNTVTRSEQNGEDGTKEKAVLAASKSHPVVQMRRSNNIVSRTNELVKKNSAPVFTRRNSLEEAENEVKQMFTVWQEQEKKAKEAEHVKRLLAKRVREENAKAMRKLKTESRIIGELTSDRGSISGHYKPVPGVTSCPRGRPPRPANQQQVKEWYKEIEQPKGTGINRTTKQPANYFYGLITRQQAEEYLTDSPPGSFLIRLSDRVWGYGLSYRAADCCKHFLIDASDGRYRFFGSNQIVHCTLDDLLEHHKTTPFSIVGKELLRSPLSVHPQLDRASLLPMTPEIEISHL